MIAAKDQYDNDIRVGSIITYPVRQSSNMWMSTALVTGIEKQEQWWSEKKVPVLKVIVVSEKEKYDYKTETFALVIKETKTLVSCLDRVTVIPVTYLDLNDKVGVRLLEIKSRLGTHDE